MINVQSAMSRVECPYMPVVSTRMCSKEFFCCRLKVAQVSIVFSRNRGGINTNHGDACGERAPLPNHKMIWFC